jgi:VWFA-related protein
VLTPAREEYVKTIAPRHFSIRFGNGPWVAPKFARPEGEDPINLAILVDARSPQTELASKMPALLEGLTRSALRPHDHVSIYAIRCGVLHGSENISAVPEKVRLAAETALGDSNQRGAEASRACKADVRLWDSLAYVSHALSVQAGRRVVLALTSGDDHGSTLSANDLKKQAQNEAVTVFGFDVVRHPYSSAGLTSPVSAGWGSSRSPSVLIAGSPAFWSAGELALDDIAGATGGVSLNLEGDDPARLLERFVQMVRDRYILEFSRPANGSARELTVNVRLDDRDAFIRLGGDSIPVPGTQSIADVAGSGAIPIASSAETPAAQPVPAALPAQPAIQAKVPVPSATPAQPPTVEQVPVPPAQSPVAALDKGASSQQQTGNSPVAGVPTQTIRVTTRLTIEDVVVSDSHRRPVHGLLPSDFELKEDGKLQVIRNFAEYGTGGSSAPATASGGNETTAAKRGSENASSAGPGAIDVILLDSVSTGLSSKFAMSPDNFAVEREQSIKFLRGLPGGTRVAILQFGEQVQLLQNVTQDKSALLAAMNAAHYKPVTGTYFEALEGPYSRAQNERSACDAANAQSVLTLAALERLAAILSTAHGRKNVMWFTPGAPWLTRYKEFSRVNCVHDYTSELRQVYSQLNAAQIALYPIDPRGLFTDPTIALTKSPVGIPATWEATRAGAKSVAAFNSNANAEHGALTDLAEATGGTAYFNRNDLDAALSEAISSGNDYYSLAYIPPLSQYDGMFHSIGVKVSRPHIELHYREGYFAVSPENASK